MAVGTTKREIALTGYATGTATATGRGVGKSDRAEHVERLRQLEGHL